MKWAILHQRQRIANVLLNKTVCKSHHHGNGVFVHNNCAYFSFHSVECNTESVKLDLKYVFTFFLKISILAFRSLS